MKTAHLDIGADFSPWLGPRLRSTGPNSGQQFREEQLIPAFDDNDVIIVHLDGIRGFSASFFEEAFGGLVRERGLDEVRKKLRFEAVTMTHILPLVNSYMEDAEKMRRRGAASAVGRG